MALLIFVSLAYIVTVVRRIRIAQRWFGIVLFPVFPTIFLCIAFLSFGFTVIAISRQIRFFQWWVWQWWVWPWVRWYVCFFFFLWKVRWSCLQFRWSCSWRGFWNYCSGSNRVNWWCCSVGSLCTNRNRVQMWSTHWNIWHPKCWFPLQF